MLWNVNNVSDPEVALVIVLLGLPHVRWIAEDMTIAISLRVACVASGVVVVDIKCIGLRSYKFLVCRLKRTVALALAMEERARSGLSKTSTVTLRWRTHNTGSLTWSARCMKSAESNASGTMWRLSGRH